MVHYPLNHHLRQLYRFLAALASRYGRVAPVSESSASAT
jgi:hypothetical protein